MEPLKAITFDFWETLVQDSAENLRAQRALRIGALREVLGRAGRSLRESEVEEAYNRSERLLDERFWSRHRDPLIEEQVRLVLDTAAPGVTVNLAPALFADAVAGYIDPVLRLPPALHLGAAEAVAGLAARGIALGIVSNTGRTPGIILRKVLERHNLLHHFAAVSYSDEVGYRKPDAEIFHRTLAVLGAEARAAAHVGDNPVADVQGAQGIGMRGVHFAAGGAPGATHADLVVTDLRELLDHVRG
jgi:putative hydrolase of the HAD superfamily